MIKEDNNFYVTLILTALVFFISLGMAETPFKNTLGTLGLIMIFTNIVFYNITKSINSRNENV